MEHLAALKLILDNCKNKIHSYSIQLNLSDDNVLSPLVLNNVQNILTDIMCIFQLFGQPNVKN